LGFVRADGARAALNLGGTMLGYYPVRVLPSKTAIVPVNPTFLPRVWIQVKFYLHKLHHLSSFSLMILFLGILWMKQSEDEREMCARTVYCTNIDKKV